jgi:hypothetical protein
MARAQDEGVAPPGQGVAPADANPAEAGADQSVSFQTFYDALSGAGTWIQTADYGYVWQPQIDDPSWAPYTRGHWAYTQDQWTWVSDEPWGWAVFHYGRWVNLDGVGWCWVPGYTWAPAWVSWRYGDGYCGWAPLPPDSLLGIDYEDGAVVDGFHIGGDCDSYYGIGALWYNFLPVVYFGEPDYRSYYANRRENEGIMRQTTNVTNLNLTRNRSGGMGGAVNFASVTLGGPSLRQVDAVSQAPVPEATLAFTARAGGGTLQGNTLAIYAPQVDVRTVQTSRPPGGAQSIGPVVVNRGRDAGRPLVATSHFSPGATAAPQGVRTAVTGNGGAVVNDSVQHATVTTPFTGMRPMVFPSGVPAETFTRPSSTPAAPSNERPAAPSYTHTTTGYHGATTASPGSASPYNGATTTTHGH